MGYRMVKKNYDNVLSRFHLVQERNGRTDRHTDLLYQYRILTSDNKTILKPRVAAASGRANTYTWDFPDVKFRLAALIRQ